MNETAVEDALIAMTNGINERLATLDYTERSTALANLTIRLFRACEQTLTDEGMERLVEAIEDDDDAEAEGWVH